MNHTRNSWLRTLRKAALVLSAFNLAVGCTPSQPAPTQQEQQSTSSAFLSIRAADILEPAPESGQGKRVSAQAFSYSDVKSIRIDVKEKDSGNVLYVNFDLSLVETENVWEGELPLLPKGVALRFTAAAYGAPNPGDGVRPLLFTGTLDQTFSADNVDIAIVLSPANDKQTIQLPRIRRISVPNELSSDQSGNISFTVEATTGEPLQYTITAAPGGGSFYPVSGAITLAATTGTFVSQYVAPSVTEVTHFEHTVRVTNKAGHSVTTTFKTKVKPAGSSDGVKDTDVSVLFNPVINSIAARRVLDTNNVIFEASVADDGDIRTLIFNWDFEAPTGTTYDPEPDFSEAGNNPTTLVNYTAAVQGKVTLTVKDANEGTTTLFYNLTPDQFPNNPIVEGNTTGINTIRAGESHTCVLLSTGAVRCWGHGAFGQLGLNSTDNVGNTPSTLPSSVREVPVVGTATRIVTGANHTCALLSTGFVRCWGRNNFGQLGLNSTDNVGDGEEISSMGYVNLGGIATQITAGYHHTCALLTTGNVRCWGLNNYGQLGLNNQGKNIGDDEVAWSGRDVQVGTELSGITVKDVVAGGHHTCVITNNDKVRCWGHNNSGQLGYGNTKQIGDDEYPYEAGDVDVGGPVAQLAAGSDHTCALLQNGNMKCWGYNYHGQLGYGTSGWYSNLASPGLDVNTGGKVLQMSAGATHTCALLSSGGIKCWGNNTHGQLGYNGGGQLTTPSASPMNLSGFTAYRVSAGLNHTCALLSSGAARCWGYNNYGQLGYGHINSIGANPGDISVMPATSSGSTSGTP